MSTAAANDSGELDELWSAPPEKFVELRNAAAARARASGDSAGAAAIKALKRPTPSAWLVNALVRSAPKEVDAMVRAGDALIAAQGRVLAGADPGEMHDAMRALREAISKSVKRARTVLADHGRKPTTDLVRRVTATLRSASLDRRVRDVVLEGRLSTDPGVDEVEALGDVKVPARVAPPPKQKPKVDAKARAREEAAAKKLAARKAEEERQREEREAKARAAHEARERLRAEVEAAELAVEEARRAHTQAEAEERRAKAAAAEAAHAVEQSHRALVVARERLARAKKRAR